MPIKQTTSMMRAASSIPPLPRHPHAGRQGQQPALKRLHGVHVEPQTGEQAQGPAHCDNAADDEGHGVCGSLQAVCHGQILPQAQLARPCRRLWRLLAALLHLEPGQGMLYPLARRRCLLGSHLCPDE